MKLTVRSSAILRTNPVIPSSQRSARILTSLLSDSHSALHCSSPPGTLRGIDVYSIRSLLTLLSRGLDKYQAVSGVPVSDPEHAEILAEKIFWSKFFRPMTLPTIANKLTAYSALPQEAQRLVRRPDVVWQSSQPQLPPKLTARWWSFSPGRGANRRSSEERAMANGTGCLPSPSPRIRNSSLSIGRCRPMPKA
jgi:hypothetical protein